MMPSDYPSTKSELLACTSSLPDDAFFQEHSRTRELTYIGRSYGRWMEIINLVRRHLPNIQERSCLDVGCSPFTFLLRGYFKKVSALDLTDAFQQRCRAASIRLYGGGLASSQAVAQVEKVDCVFCLEVLEHLHANPVDVISRLHSVLLDGGLLVLSTPNLMCFANRINMVLNKKLRHFTYPPFSEDDAAHGFAHDRIYSPAELQDYFRSSGFREVRTSYLYHFDDLRHVGLPCWRRLLSVIPQVVKAVVPPLRDGTIMLGFKR
jgi:SAM-dependent methyltransferase